jgi:competence protein ComEA
MNQWLEKHGTLVLTLVGLLIVVGVIAFLVRWQSPPPIVIEPPLPTPTPEPIQVYVSGAVVHPDVYVLPVDSTVNTALEAAGGPTEEADLEHLNLAHHLKDGEHVYVPRVGEASSPTPHDEGDESEVPVAFPVNINTASQAELETLPGIGPVLAQRIIDYRENDATFSSIEDIQNVPGIGPATFEDIKELITVD